MRRLLLIDDNEKYTQALSKALQTNLGADIRIINTDSVLHGIEFIRQLSSVEIIIVRNIIGEQQAASEMASFLLGEGKAIPVIMLGKAECKLPPLCSVVADPFKNWKDVVSSVEQFLKASPAPIIGENEFARVPTGYLKNLNKLPCDLHLKVRQRAGKYTFLKRIEEGEPILRGDICEFERLGLNSFYVEENARRLMVNSAIKSTVELMEKGDNEIADLIQALEVAYKLVCNEVASFGFIDDIASMFSSMILYLERIVSHEKLRTKVASLLIKMDIDISFKRTVLTHLACMTMVNASEWGNTAQLEKLIYTTYLHDLALGGKSDLSLIMGNEELSQSNVAESDQELVNHHAVLGSLLAQQYQNLPQGVDRIIREHHGSLSGDIFNNEFEQGISALAIVFIVAERFASELLYGCMQGDGFSSDQLYERLYECFPQKAAYNLVHHLQTNVVI